MVIVEEIIKKIKFLTEDKKIDEALKLCSRTIKQHPKNEDLYFTRSYLWAKKKMYDKAIKDMEMLGELTQDSIILEKKLQPLFTKARWIIMSKHRYKEAIEVLTIIIDKNNEYFLNSSYLLRAWANLQINEDIKALNDCNKIPIDTVLYIDKEVKLISPLRIKEIIQKKVF